MATESFASTAQMEQRSLGAITATSHPFLEKELAAATREIQKYCRWHIFPVMDIAKVSRSRHWRDIWVPAMQISDVVITTLDEVDHVLAAEEFDPETGWTSWSGDRYTLTYTAGYIEVPEDLVTLTLQIAARALGAPLGFSREQAGSVSVTHSVVAPGVAGGDVLLDHEKTSLAAYRIERLP